MEWKNTDSREKGEFLEFCATDMFVAGGLFLAAAIAYFAPWPFKAVMAAIIAGALLSLASNYYKFR
jgi:hypothetical protein|nr:MAG TPA: hypothetical protein [Caudoviricetes sp.]